MFEKAMMLVPVVFGIVAIVVCFTLSQKNWAGVAAAGVVIIIAVFAIRGSITSYDLEETAREKAYTQSCKRSDRVWKEQHSGYSEETYSQWLRRERRDEYRQAQLKRYRKRYYGEE